MTLVVVALPHGLAWVAHRIGWNQNLWAQLARLILASHLAAWSVLHGLALAQALRTLLPLQELLGHGSLPEAQTLDWRGCLCLCWL